MPLTALIGFIVVVAVVVLMGVGTVIVNSTKESTVTTESQLEKALEIDKLSSAKFSYNGIAVKKDDKGHDEYHVKYNSTVTVSFSMNDVSFKKDEGAKKIIVYLPVPQIDSPGY